MRLLHILSRFDPDSVGLRTARLINAFGKGAEHVVVSAEAGAHRASSVIDRGISVTYSSDFPSLAGLPTPGRLQRLAKAMVGHDLILTYGWAAMDAVMAHTLFGEFHGLPPLVHHEGESGGDDAQVFRRSRTWYRRIALGRASKVIVTTRELGIIARENWHVPAGKVKFIANGLDTAAYGRTPKPDVLPRVIKRPGERWLGTVADLRHEKHLKLLVRAFTALPDEWQFVILGEGAKLEAIREEALRHDVAHRVHLPGPVTGAAKVMGLFDIFAVSSDSEQASLVEAMAAGLPIASTQLGNVAGTVAEENHPFIVSHGDEDALASALVALAEDQVLRRRVGDANRRRAKAQFDAKVMEAAYRAVYAQALRRPSFP